MPPSSIVTVPFAGSVVATIVSGSPFGSMSFANTSIETGTPCGVAALSSMASGAASPTTTVTVAVASFPSGSWIVYVKVSTPWKPGFGV